MSSCDQNSTQANAETKTRSLSLLLSTAVNAPLQWDNTWLQESSGPKYWKIFSVFKVFSIRAYSNVPLKSQYLYAAPLIFLTYFNIMYKQDIWTAFNPFLNSEKDGDSNITCG